MTFLSEKNQQMVEVFKTDVVELYQANMIIESIQKDFPSYKVNFDLSDCDRILRVECAAGSIDASEVITLLKKFKISAEVLPDNLPQKQIPKLLYWNQ